MDVQVLWRAGWVRGWVGEGACAADHGEEDGEGVGWVGEGDVQDGAGVDEGVDCCVVVRACHTIGMHAIYLQDWVCVVLPLFASRPSLLTAVLGYSGLAIGMFCRLSSHFDPVLDGVGFT